MPLRKSLTKEGIITTIIDCTTRAGHVPGLAELQQRTGLARQDMTRFFGSYTAALKACGLTKTGSGMRAQTKDLLLDWAKVARALKKIPTVYEYERDGLYSEVPFRGRFGMFSKVPKAMKLYVKENELEGEWQDVLQLIDNHVPGKRLTQQEILGQSKSKILPERPVYGRLLRPSPLVCAPVNEQGVIFLFGALAERMGFQMLRIQTEYPDGEALRMMSENRLQRVRIEFEFESRNFLRHNHDPAFCDLIVCWEDNWPDSPLEVIELKKAYC
jgi:hypothetical protein